jgi:hypothetical protein
MNAASRICAKNDQDYDGVNDCTDTLINVASLIAHTTSDSVLLYAYSADGTSVYATVSVRGACG